MSLEDMEVEAHFKSKSRNSLPISLGWLKKVVMTRTLDLTCQPELQVLLYVHVPNG